MSATGAVLVLSTTPDRDTAVSLASELVERRLAACCNLVDGVTSIYRWEGKREESSEVLLLIKTSAERVDALTRAIVELHPYDVPEVIAVDLTAAHIPYLDWMFKMSSGASDEA
jgi:periplasmic divalent cation tolerance protein